MVLVLQPIKSGTTASSSPDVYQSSSSHLVPQIQLLPTISHICELYLLTYTKVRDNEDNTVEENSGIFCLIRMRWLPSARVCG